MTPHSESSSKVNSLVRIHSVGMLGLGIMGSAIATNLALAGFEVLGYDPAVKDLTEFKAAGGRHAESIAEVAATSDAVLMSLPNQAAFTDAIQALVESTRAGVIVSDLSTLAVQAKTQAESQLQAVGAVFLDTPLSGTGGQAKKKDLVVYASGDAEAIARMNDVYLGFARKVYEVGAVGFGMKMKLVSNLLVAIHNASTAEALVFSERLGIDSALAVTVLADGGSTSRMFEVRGPMMRDRSWNKPGMKVGVFQKDLALILDELAKSHACSPLFNAAVPLYNGAMGLGHEHHDTSSIHDVLDRMSSLA